MTHIVIKNIIENSPHLSWIKDNTALLVLHGSRAYGTNTKDSDYDYKGIAIAPPDYYHGFIKTFEQATLKEPDAVIYDIKKFFKLASDCNPNLLEVLYCDDSDIVIMNDIGKQIRENRDLFLSKRARFSFSGYAISQLKRLKTHRGWLMGGEPDFPQRSDFGLPERSPIPTNQLTAAKSAINKELDRLNFKFLDQLDNAERIEVRNQVVDMLEEFLIYHEDRYVAMAKKIGFDDNVIEILKQERAYDQAKRDWDNYQTWKKNRNKKRAEDEAKFGFDCYTDDTEFLTNNGWKKFDDICEQDKLATILAFNVPKHKIVNTIEYQNFTEKFDGSFTGNMYNLYGNHMDVCVTPNHRMYFSKVERNTNKQYEWELNTAANLPDTFNILRTITPNLKNYSNKEIESFKHLPFSIETYLRLMGWYLADGSVNIKKNKIKQNKVNSIRISQIKGGKLQGSMLKFANKYKDIAQASYYEYDKPPNDFNPYEHVGAVLNIRNRIVAHNIYNDCGSVKNKRIPRYIFSLSKRLMEILLDAMIAGDGTKFRPDNGIIYYTSLKTLADDVQELAFLCGFETSLYGPYDNVTKKYPCQMYHVHINKTRNQNKLCIRSKNIKKISVKNQRIVCFSVPNGTLITRRNGHIGLHGNCKHAYHLIRLLRMAKEILTTGKVIVKRPDREELLSIRNGAWSYEKMVEHAESIESEIKKLYETSTLPHKPNLNKLHNLCFHLIEQQLNK